MGHRIPGGGMSGGTEAQGVDAEPADNTSILDVSTGTIPHDVNGEYKHTLAPAVSLAGSEPAEPFTHHGVGNADPSLLTGEKLDIKMGTSPHKLGL